MFKLSLVLLITTLLVACSSKKEKALLEVYAKNKTYHQQLQKIEKLQLKVDGITKVLLTATYRYNPKEKTSDEVFIVGVYMEEYDIQSFTQEGFALTLNGKKIKSIKTLEKNNPLLKEISFVSQWSQFYLVHFPHTSKKSFNLILKSDLYGKGSLHFAKVAKYVLVKKHLNNKVIF